MNSYEEGASVQAYLYRLTGKKKRIKIPYYFIFVVGISCKKEKKKKKQTYIIIVKISIILFMRAYESFVCLLNCSVNLN